MVQLLDVPGDLFYLGKKTNISELMAPTYPGLGSSPIVFIVLLAITCPSADAFSTANMQMASA